MNLLRSLALAFALIAGSGDAAAQRPVVLAPEPLPMGVPYLYQPGNPYQFYPLNTPAYFTAYPSPYPFGSTGPVFGRYSWDYGYPYRAGLGYYTANLPPYPYPYSYPTLPGRVWMGYGW